MRTDQSGGGDGGASKRLFERIMEPVIGGEGGRYSTSNNSSRRTPPLPPVAVGPHLMSPSPFPAAATTPEEESDEEEVASGGSGSAEPDGGKRKKVSKFIGATYSMLMDSTNAAAIRFSEDGIAIEIMDTLLLRDQVLSKFFNHNTLSSFTRQLHNYNFEARPCRPGVHQTYSHPSFFRGRVDLLDRVQRKIKTMKKPDLAAQLNEAREREQVLIKRVKVLEDERYALHDHNRSLAHENSRLRAMFQHRPAEARQQHPHHQHQPNPIYPAPLPVRFAPQQQYPLTADGHGAHHQTSEQQMQHSYPDQSMFQARPQYQQQQHVSSADHLNGHFGAPSEPSPLSSPFKVSELPGWFE